MLKQQKHININKLRSYSSTFSSTSFYNLIKKGDLTFLNSRIKNYDYSKFEKGIFITYHDYIKYIYRELSKSYRTEYFYKNTFINKILIKKYGIKDSIAISEFKVGKSIADLVLFNGVSKAFEIKTELDTKRRLKGQLDDYKKIFNYSYIITDISIVEQFINEDSSIGIIVLQKEGRVTRMIEYRPAKLNKKMDYLTLIKSLRTPEYKAIVQAYYGKLPEMNSFNMFDICQAMMKEIPPKTLSQLFLSEIKKRKSNTQHLSSYDKELRQLALAMRLDKANYKELKTHLDSPIKL